MVLQEALLFTLFSLLEYLWLLILPPYLLSADGWITGNTAKCDLLFSHFFVAEVTQTAFFPESVSSLPALIQKYQDDPMGLSDGVKDSLTRYFGSYFPKVEVQVACTENPEKRNSFDLRMFVSVWDNEGTEFVLAKLAEHQDAKILRIININNVQ